jgi:1,4-dihydroxy-2-naphthoyl-CoA hydrolase
VRKAPDVLVYAEATALHLGRTTHLWNVDIKTENGRLVSTVRVTNFIVKDKSESWK